MIAKLCRRFFPAKVLLSDYEALQEKLKEAAAAASKADDRRYAAECREREFSWRMTEAERAVRRLQKQRDDALRGFSPLVPVSYARIEDEPSLSPVAFATLEVDFPRVRLAVSPEVLRNTQIPTIDIARSWAEAQVAGFTDAFAAAINRVRKG